MLAIEVEVEVKAYNKMGSRGLALMASLTIR